MCVQKVGDWHRVRSVRNIRRFEDLLDVALGLKSHVLLAKGAGVLLNVRMLLQYKSVKALRINKR